MKRMILAILLGLFIVVGLSSCGPKEYITYELAELCDVEGAQYVTVSGVLQVPASIGEEKKHYTMYLGEEVDGKTLLWMGIPVGTKNNQMEPIENNFTMDDIKIRTDDGQFVTDGDTVTVSGRYQGYCNAGLIWFTVEKIEAP